MVLAPALPRSLHIQCPAFRIQQSRCFSFLHHFTTFKRQQISFVTSYCAGVSFYWVSKAASLFFLISSIFPSRHATALSTLPILAMITV